MAVTTETRTTVHSQESAVLCAQELGARFAVTAAEVDRTAAFPFANFEALREAGLLNLTVPARLGGSGAGLETACRVVAAIGGGEPSTALVYAMHLIYHALPALNGRWTASVHEMMCRESVEGIALVNVMRVEPELGTPTRGGLPAMTAERTSPGWRISGHKMYATGSPLLRYFICWARTAGDDPRVSVADRVRARHVLDVFPLDVRVGERSACRHHAVFREVATPLAPGVHADSEDRDVPVAAHGFTGAHT